MVTLAPHFLQTVYHLHVFPCSIISNRDPYSSVIFGKNYLKKLGTTLQHSNAYHSQSDIQSEVVNHCLESYLCCFASAESITWHRHLYLVEYRCNSTHHSFIGMWPF